MAYTFRTFEQKVTRLVSNFPWLRFSVGAAGFCEIEFSCSISAGPAIEYVKLHLRALETAVGF